MPFEQQDDHNFKSLSSWCRPTCSKLIILIIFLIVLMQYATNIITYRQNYVSFHNYFSINGVILKNDNNNTSLPSSHQHNSVIKQPNQMLKNSFEINYVNNNVINSSNESSSSLSTVSSLELCPLIPPKLGKPKSKSKMTNFINMLLNSFFNIHLNSSSCLLLACDNFMFKLSLLFIFFFISF